jgi:DNA-binding winged helix-turn-helix (wHTH) protein/tetratricopeptide (TPR) repeat protein
LDGNTLVATTAAELARWGEFRLGSTRIDPASREVVGPGGADTIEPRVMQVLLVLAHAAGGVVTRDDLSRLCWNSQIVGDDALNRAIGEVRRLARTVAADEFGVETIPRTGYRLTGATIATDGAEPATTAPEPTPGAVAPRRSRRWMVGAAALGVTAAAAGAWALWPDRGARQAADLAEQARLAMVDGLPAGAVQAAGLLQQAVTLRPRDAALWGKLALAWRAQAEFAGPAETAAAVKACELAAARAMALDPAQADARTALIMLRSVYGDWLVVEQRLRAVLAASPGHEEATSELAALLASVGRFAESAALIDELVVRQPLSPVYQYRHVYTLWARGRVGDADRAADRALALWPRHPSVWAARLWLMGFTGRAGAALAQIDDVEGRPAEMSSATIGLLRTAMVAAQSREPRAIQAAVQASMAAARAGPGASINAIMILSALGRLDEAFEVADGYMLRRGPSITPLRATGPQAVATDTRHRHSQVLFIPATAPMRADARFMPMCEACGLADYWRQSGHRPDFLAGKPA